MLDFCIFESHVPLLTFPQCMDSSLLTQYMLGVLLCFVTLLLKCFCYAMDVLFDKYLISLLSISILDLMQ